MITFENSWMFPVPPMELPRNDVHVWHLELDRPCLDLLELASTLSAEERTRAANFRFERHRNRFITRRGVLRTLLGLYLNMKPELVEFCYSRYGKPYLAERFHKEAIQFNLAHSHERAIYAFARNRKVGVDLEYIHDMQGFEKVAAGLFSKRENAILRILSRDEKLRAFFDCWTRKEAYGKAIGIGLTQALDQFEGLQSSGGVPACDILKNHAKEVTQWSITSFAPAPEYIAKFVVEGHSWHLHHFQFLPKIVSKCVDNLARA